MRTRQSKAFFDLGDYLKIDPLFTSTLGGGFYDLTTPNEAYWSHVDFIVQQAAANGLQCVFTPLDQGGWTQTSLVNGTTRCQQYGQFLGNRYKNYPNIIWNFGNDFQQWRTQQNDAVILAIADGLRSTDSNHLITIQLDYLVSESQDDPNWISRINTNGVYTYYPTYAETLVAYNKPTIMPVLFLEENYEDENNVGELGTPKVLRRQEYWSMGGGALAGHMYGSYWTDRFANGWQSHLNTQAVDLIPKMPRFCVSRPSDTTTMMAGEIWWQERAKRRQPSTIKCPFGKTHAHRGDGKCLIVRADES